MIKDRQEALDFIEFDWNPKIDKLGNKIDRSLLGDKDFILEAIKSSIAVLEFAAEELYADRDIVLKAVKRDGSAALQYASDELRNDPELIKIAKGNN